MVRPARRLAKRAKGRIAALGRWRGLRSNVPAGARCFGPGVCPFRDRRRIGWCRHFGEIEKHEPRQLQAAYRWTKPAGCLRSNRLRWRGGYQSGTAKTRECRWDRPRNHCFAKAWSELRSGPIPELRVLAARLDTASDTIPKTPTHGLDPRRKPVLKKDRPQTRSWIMIRFNQHGSWSGAWSDRLRPGPAYCTGSASNSPSADITAW